MATKLRQLKVRKVDFVDQGANPDAHIRMLKRKDGEGQTTEEGSKKESGNILKKLLGFIGKAAGMDQSEIDSAIDVIQKGDSVSFDEKYRETKYRKITEEIWDICYALQSSLCSILCDEELDSTAVATEMKVSLEEFNAVMQEAITEWSNGKESNIVRKEEALSQADMDIMKAAVERLNDTIKKSASAPNGDADRHKEGVEEEMKLEKSKMTEAERAFLESLEKRYGVDEGGSQTSVTVPAVGTAVPPQETVPKTAESGVIKSATQATTNVVTAEPDDIYKGLHPLVAAEMAELKKFKEAAEEKELTDVAKKYEIIGKKPEELVPLFKNLKAAGGTAYNDMIAILDQTVEAVEKSGIFSEVGKSGHGGNGNSAEAKVIAVAKKYMEENPNMSYQEAVAKAWEDNPDLLAEYDEQEGF